MAMRNHNAREERNENAATKRNTRQVQIDLNCGKKHENNTRKNIMLGNGHACWFNQLPNLPFFGGGLLGFLGVCWPVLVQSCPNPSHDSTQNVYESVWGKFSSQFRPLALHWAIAKYSPSQNKSHDPLPCTSFPYFFRQAHMFQGAKGLRVRVHVLHSHLVEQPQPKNP